MSFVIIPSKVAPLKRVLFQALAPYVSEILGIDKSQKMVSEYNKIAQKSASTNPSCRMKAFRGDISAFPEDQPGLTDEVESNDEIQSFDLIAISVSQLFACPRLRADNSIFHSSLWTSSL